jgi:hypothetical protein
MKNKMSITIKVIQNDNISNRRLAEYLARKYEEEIRKTQLQKS